MYKFEKINEDTYKLITDDTEFAFTKTVDLARDLQKVDMYTTSYLIDMLAERGETIENTKLRIEKKEGNKTIVDESNLNLLKGEARKLAYYDVMNIVFKKLFGKDFISILKDLKIDINNLGEVEKFTTELTQILVNGIKDNTPRREN